MKNNGFGLTGILVIIFALLVIGMAFSVVKNADFREDQDVKSDTITEINQNDSSSDFETKPEADFVFAEDSEKNEIQNLLNKQCRALSNKDLKTLISTVDQTNIDLFQEYTKSTDILLSLIDFVIKCRYEIQDIQFNKDAQYLTAETTERGDLEIKFINGSTEIIDNPDTSYGGKYIKIEGEWRQIIQFNK